MLPKVLEEERDIGLSTNEALISLNHDIETVLKTYEDKYKNESFLHKARISFARPLDSPLGWFPIILTLLSIGALVFVTEYTAALVTTALMLANIALVIRENNLRRTEIYRKVRAIMSDIKLAAALCRDWIPDNFPHLCSPLSPCVTLQWTYRDKRITNLPWALLVKGDHIVMRPGQVSPGMCTEVAGRRKFKCGETYGLQKAMDPPVKPVARAPLPDLICIMEQTPYLDNLRTSLDKFCKRPATIYNQQRFLLVTKYIQQWGALIAFLATILSGLFHYTNYSTIGAHKISSKIGWTHLFIESTVSSVLPILPLIFPLMWIAINLWGIARLETLLYTTESVLQPHKSDQQKHSFEEDLDTPTCDYITAPLSTVEVFTNWIGLWMGSSELLGRSANVVQVLGSITALCCIDKKGILSWPNPTAEKVFFLRDGSEKLASMSSESSLESDTSTQNINAATTTAGAIAEVLDLTHDQHSPFRMEFDDHEWKNYINSLKPMGLAILVNTCCPLTQAHYAQFCGHVTAVAMLDKDLVPVTNRYAIVESRLNSFMHGRCLCELAKQIGFTNKARDIFNLQGQIASYRHLQPDVVRRDIRFARQLQIASKVKVPFPHSLSVVMREAHSGSLQLLTQGTADIVLDCCDDYWDGKDLQPLGPLERKRAQDFYQRSALTAYCTAFAYRPLRHGIAGALGAGDADGDIAYLELPAETRSKMTVNMEPRRPETLNHSISTDSLLFSSENKDDPIADVDGCFQMQCHQVFIGMVTMQYQAQTDIVQLVERLDRACVRFVHFSKENELRSRVFSEKMGLESGWNCHISLLSETQSEASSPTSLKSGTPTKHPDDDETETDINRLLPPSTLESSKTLSSSAPCAISEQSECCPMIAAEEDGDQVTTANNNNKSRCSTPDQDRRWRFRTRHSKDSAMDDENGRSLSCLTDSSEQSAPIHFDMSNRAKLPRGIENIRPHLENVDNVPLLVSLFTDCSAEATRQMLDIMQSYGEIVVCLGSSASNANAEIFLQADCSVAVEPLYPQVCQDIPPYTEANILNNRQTFMRHHKHQGTMLGALLHPQHVYPRHNTISPIYLSRMLNSIPCSISVCRDDSLSIVGLIELSRRFSLGLWNCIQFWACCGCFVALLNTLASVLHLPPLVTPLASIYIMCVAVPMLAVPLVRVETDSMIMNRATGKKQTKFDSKVLAFVIWCYGCKFLPSIFFTLFSYCALMSHPVKIFEEHEDASFDDVLSFGRQFVVFAVVVHFVIISFSFVHRDYSAWQKSPFSNRPWVAAAGILVIVHLIACILPILLNDTSHEILDNAWPAVVVLFASTIITFSITELCKWQEIKANLRYQRRARLDFGTKLGMNSPF